MVRAGALRARWSIGDAGRGSQARVRSGWLAARAGKPLDRPVRRIKLSEETAVRAGVERSAPVLGRAPGGERVAFGAALYVRTDAGLEGWI